MAWLSQPHDYIVQCHWWSRSASCCGSGDRLCELESGGVVGWSSGRVVEWSRVWGRLLWDARGSLVQTRVGGHFAHVDAAALEVEVLVVRNHLGKHVEYALF